MWHGRGPFWMHEEVPANCAMGTADASHLVDVSVPHLTNVCYWTAVSVIFPLVIVPVYFLQV